MSTRVAHRYAKALYDLAVERNVFDAVAADIATVRNADRILVMSQGRLVADGAPETFFRADLEPEAAALIEPPRRQAARIRALEQEAARDE